MVSIIMATYNCASTVREAIDSIIEQDYSNWEFVICDDCSNDGTYDILKEYQNKLPNKFVILRNKTNSKLPYSLNRCLASARGKYIARLDGDDLSVSSRLMEQYLFLEANPNIAVVGTNMAQFDEKGIFGEIKMKEIPTQNELLTTTPFCHATIMMRKSVYDQIGGYTELKRTIRGQDIDLWFKFFYHGYEGRNIPKPLYLVREDRAAIKRRKLKYRMYETITRIKGFKMLRFPFYKYIYALIPVASYFIPTTLKRKMRNLKKH